jgi:hypothetical protein
LVTIVSLRGLVGLCVVMFILTFSSDTDRYADERRPSKPTADCLSHELSHDCRPKKKGMLVMSWARNYRGPVLKSSSSSSYGCTAKIGPGPPLLEFRNNNLFTGLDC